MQEENWKGLSPNSTTKVTAEPEIASEKNSKTVYGCLVDLMNLRDNEQNHRSPKNHEDHGRKGFTSINENSRCKTRNGDNLSMQFGRSQEQERVYPGSVETLPGWGVISRSPHRRIDVMFGPVVTTEAQLAFSGTRIHSNTSLTRRL